MQFEIGAVLAGKVSSITKFGAFVELPEGKTGMIHISEVSAAFVREIRDFLTEGQEVEVKLINIDDQGRISLSIKRLQLEAAAKQAAEMPKAPRPSRPSGQNGWGAKPRVEPQSFEEMLNRFKQDSDEKMSAIKRNTENKRGTRRRG